MKIENFRPFDGQHCETTTTGTLLRQLNIDLSEPMLFGLGEGLGFIFWNMKTMNFPFIGGRIKPDLLTQNIIKNLNLELIANETSSMQKAGTGGALFRNLYRDFLQESYELLKLGTLAQAHKEFIEIANLWTDVSNLFLKVSISKDKKHIEQASEILKLLSGKEKEVMEKLVKI
ncbi:BtrH N-terminal domain-containing protein [Leptospira biflexa]|uniref:BtrH N-terminal domain-containing protein n=1 Tax=Leptospira biflexa TaxID=172 RepID=UPI00143834EB|nr:BtrH N-terminal domain-containing protein [Leptospira biflexa]